MRRCRLPACFGLTVVWSLAAFGVSLALESAGASPFLRFAFFLLLSLVVSAGLAFLLATLIERVDKTAEELREAKLEVVSRLATIAEYRDDETG